MGAVGRRVVGWFARAPGLDVLVTWFTVLPWLVGGIVFGWPGLLGGIAGQVVGLVLWCWGHELTHRKAVKGARIVTVLNRLVGRRGGVGRVLGVAGVGWRGGGEVWGGAGRVGGVAGQVVGVVRWCWGHELTHRKAVKGARIVTVLNRLVGRPRNHAALWVTTL